MNLLFTFNMVPLLTQPGETFEAIYEDKSQETAVAIIQNFWHMITEEDNNISEHLTILKKY